MFPVNYRSFQTNRSLMRLSPGTPNHKWDPRECCRNLLLNNDVFIVMIKGEGVPQSILAQFTASADPFLLCYKNKTLVEMMSWLFLLFIRSFLDHQFELQSLATMAAVSLLLCAGKCHALNIYMDLHGHYKLTTLESLLLLKTQIMQLTQSVLMLIHVNINKKRQSSV